MRRFGIVITATVLFSLLAASCATKPETAVLTFVDPKLYDNLMAEVSKAGWDIKHSLPELKHAKGHFSLGRSTNTIELLSSEGEAFQVLVLECPSMGTLNDNFMLAYLKNPEGKIVDWKSRWLSTRQGHLETRLLDVNGDGVKEFCFVCERFERSEQILAAYSIQQHRFEPVIAEQISYFTVEFAEIVQPDGLLLQPQLKGQYGWETGKLYEIPVQVINQSHDEISLKGCSLWLSGEFFGWGMHGGFDVETLGPGDQVDTTVVVRFTERVSDSKLSFKIERRGE